MRPDLGWTRDKDDADKKVYTEMAYEVFENLRERDVKLYPLLHLALAPV